MVILAITRLKFHDGLNNNEFRDCCISLAKEIDGAIWKNLVPENVQELFLNLIHACRRRCDDVTKVAVMTLMISVKNACQLGWFPQRETQELMGFIDPMWNDLGCPENAIPSVNSPICVVLQVIERFYPFAKLGHVLLSFEAEAGPIIHVKDFHISEKMQHPSKEMVGLFVVRTEDISKSNCIIHPQEVSFLLNGKGIENRMNISMDSGPQLPTDVTSLLHYGANMLQTIGSYGGSYLIVIAFMNFAPLSEADKPVLKDYVHSQANVSKSDCDIIEGPSRISLKCPISRARIKLPVKGHVCKHLQSFDFWNYVSINKRRPSWRCPLCNQSVCYIDIRVDQNMTKILERVDSNAEAVVISADGSWTVVRETDEDVELMPESTHERRDPNSFQNLGPTVLDLTRDETEMETTDNTHNVASESTMRNHPSASNNALPQHLNAFSGQQYMNLPQLVNIQDSAARQTSFPQDRLATNTPSHRTTVPVAQFQGSHVGSSQFQGSHVSSLEHFHGRTSDLMDRWNTIYESSINRTQSSLVSQQQHHYQIQNQRLSSRSLSQAQQSPMPSYGGMTGQRPMQYSNTHPQYLHVNYGGSQDQRNTQRPIQYSNSHPRNLDVNYGGTIDQRHMQRPMQSYITHPPNMNGNYGGGTTGQRHMQRPMPQNLSVNYGGITDQRLIQRVNPDGSVGEFSLQELVNTTPPSTVINRMRGSITPGSTGYDHMIIRPTRPVQAQAQPQQTPYNTNIANEVQAFLAHPSYPGGLSQGQGGVREDVEPELYYTMPPEAW